MLPPFALNATRSLVRTTGKVALDILRLRKLPSLAFGGGGVNEGDDYDDQLEPAEGSVGDIWGGREEEDAGQPWQTMPSEGGQTHRNADMDGNGEESSSSRSAISAIGAEVRSTISKFEGDWAKFTQGVSEAAESLRDAVNKAGSSAGSFYDSVGRVTGSVRSMTSDEVALTALLLQQLAVGGGPSPDQVLPMVQKCEREGYRPEQGMFRSYKTMTVGDLIIPGNVSAGAVGWQVLACLLDDMLSSRGYFGVHTMVGRRGVGQADTLADMEKSSSTWCHIVERAIEQRLKSERTFEELTEVCPCLSWPLFRTPTFMLRVRVMLLLLARSTCWRDGTQRTEPSARGARAARAPAVEAEI